MRKKKISKQNQEWNRICSKITNDCARVRIPRVFLSILTHFFHHVSDAMAGDDRPDHGLAMMRRGREYYRDPFYFLYGKLRFAEKRMSEPDRRRANQLFYQYHELSEKRERRFREKILRQSSRKTGRGSTHS